MGASITLRQALDPEPADLEPAAAAAAASWAPGDRVSRRLESLDSERPAAPPQQAT